MNREMNSKETWFSGGLGFRYVQDLVETTRIPALPYPKKNIHSTEVQGLWRP